ncbi:MAG: TPR end-of-group domain-containing protein [Acidimicrobiales bacterium]
MKAVGNGLAFRIRGIPVRIELSFLLVAVLLGIAARSGGLLVAWVVIVIASVLVHELGHAVAFRLFGQQPTIVLQGMGGATSGSADLTARRDLAVSLAGPLTGVVLLGLPALWLARTSLGLSPTAETIVSDVVWVNVAWSVVNLLPVLPLDGGRVMAALFALATKGEGRRQAHLVSAVVAGVGALYAFSQGYVFGALFAGLFCSMNVSALTSGRDQELRQRLNQGWVGMSQGDTPAGARAAEEVLADRPSAAVIAQATELLAWSRLVGGDAAGAATALTRFPPSFSPDPFLLGAIEMDGGRNGTALDHIVAGYARGRFGPANQALAAALVDAGLDQQLAERLLGPDGPGPAAAGQFATHLHGAGRYEEAMAVGRRALASAGPTGADDQTDGKGDGKGDGRGDGQGDGGQIAYNLACSHARSGQADAALDWLEKAADLGFADASLLDGDPDLDSLRSLPRFAALQKRLAAGP